MIRQLLAGMTGNQAPMQPMQGQPEMMFPQSMFMPMQQQMPQMPTQMDMYGQQMGGLKAALMGRMQNGFR
jgi:hypothetical protein